MAALGKGFVKATDQAIKALIVSICGEEGQGKTHFSLSAPGPIAFFNTDIGLRGVVEKFAKEKDINVFNISVPSARPEDDKRVQERLKEREKGYTVDQAIKDLLSEDARTEWDRMISGVKYALLDSDIRTLVFDTATELWEMLRLAHFGKLTEVQSWHYGPCNADYRSLIKMFFKGDDPIKNVILIHKMKTIYVNNKATDKRESAGFSGTGHMVQVNATMTKDIPWEDENGDWQTGEYNLQFNVRKGCRLRPELDGTYLTGEECTFPFMAISAVPDSDYDNWL